MSLLVWGKLCSECAEREKQKAEQEREKAEEKYAVLATAYSAIEPFRRCIDKGDVDGMEKCIAACEEFDLCVQNTEMTSALATLIAERATSRFHYYELPDFKATAKYVRVVESIKDGSISHFPFQRSDFALFPAEFPQHTLHIFGHSLDVTDRDVLRLFICNDNVQTKIFYHRKDEDDKRALGKIIKNLIQIMGQDELIRRTGGAHKTIEFMPQTIRTDEELHV